MPRTRRPFDKKNATTYALVHRPQHDPLIHDSDAPSQVFTEIAGPSRPNKKSKIKQRGDLEDEFGLSGLIRDNEGEAAEYGIYYDDTSYDYMQHMRELGGSTEAMWVEAPAAQQKRKVKVKQKLEDALREVSLNDGTDDDGGVSLEEAGVGLAPNHFTSYQDQQDVPDELAGFQPDMDARLREVLEALEDEEYVDDDEDMFHELAGEGGEEVDPDQWERNQFDDEDGWESDDTEKPMQEYNVPQDFATDARDASEIPTRAEIPELTSADDGAWLESFAKSKGDQVSGNGVSLHDAVGRNKCKPADMASSSFISTGSQFARKKKRKGALTSSTGFSMTSSALARTEPLSTLDSRFDKIAESYMEDAADGDDFDDGVSLASGITSKTSASKYSAFGGSETSEAPELMPANFDSIMDEFLGSSAGGKKSRIMKKGGTADRTSGQSGMEQLDEIRQGLGPARLSSRSRPVQKA